MCKKIQTNYQCNHFTVATIPYSSPDKCNTDLSGQHNNDWEQDSRCYPCEDCATMFNPYVAAADVYVFHLEMEFTKVFTNMSLCQSLNQLSGYNLLTSKEKKVFTRAQSRLTKKLDSYHAMVLALKISVDYRVELIENLKTNAAASTTSFKAETVLEQLLSDIQYYVSCISTWSPHMHSIVKKFTSPFRLNSIVKRVMEASTREVVKLHLASAKHDAMTRLEGPYLAVAKSSGI